MVLIGRQDFSVRAVSAETGHEQWNVTFATLQRLQPAADGALPDLESLNKPVPLTGAFLGCKGKYCC